MSIEVVAKKDGHYAHRLVREGEKFAIEKEADFSARWMEDPSGKLPTPEQKKRAEIADSRLAEAHDQSPEALAKAADKDKAQQAKERGKAAAASKGADKA